MSVVRRVLLAAVVAVGFASVASAADMPVKAPPQVAAVNWTGLYVGLEAGYGWGRNPNTDSHDPGVAGLLIGAPNPNGGLVGGTIGYNWQINNWVFGVENDLSWTGFKGTAGDIAPFNPNFSQSVKTTWLDTLRGRLGFATGRSLLYVTGGAAFTAIQDSSFNTLGNVVSQSNTVAGWTVGGGVEWKLPDPHWSVKAEYLYVAFPTQTDNYSVQNALFVDTKTRLTENIARIGINYSGW